MGNLLDHPEQVLSKLGSLPDRESIKLGQYRVCQLLGLSEQAATERLALFGFEPTDDEANHWKVSSDPNLSSIRRRILQEQLHRSQEDADSDGLTVLFYPDTRSEAEFIAHANRMDETGGLAWPFRLASLRGTQAEVADTHEDTSTEGVQVGPAAVAWVEGGYLVSLIGGPPGTSTGLTLSELIAFAEAMG